MWPPADQVDAGKREAAPAITCTASERLGYNAVMYWRAGSLALLVAFLGGAALLRSLQAPTVWWNWGALGLAVVTVAVLGIDTWRRRARQQRKAAETLRWYHMRPVTLALPVIVVLACWWLVRIPAPMGDGPAGPAVDSAQFESRWLDRPVVMVSLGDSVSTGYGAGPGLGYFDLIQRNADEVYPEMAGLDLSRVLDIRHVERLAANSSNSLAHEQTIRRMQIWPAGMFGVVCMTTGGIDLVHWYGKSVPEEGAMYGVDWAAAQPWIENFRLRLDRMLIALRDKFPGGCAVFLATIYDPTDGVGDIDGAGPMFWLPAWPDGKRIHTAFNDIIKEAAARHDHVHLADVCQTLLGHGIHCNEPANPHYDARGPDVLVLCESGRPKPPGLRRNTPGLLECHGKRIAVAAALALPAGTSYGAKRHAE